MMSNRTQLATSTLLMASALLPACASHGAEPGTGTETAGFPVLIHARTEDRPAVSGAQISLANKPLGRTDDAGNARLTLHGAEGDSVALSVKCPAAYASPDRPLLVGLRHLGDGSTAVRFEVECFSLQHTVVVGLRAENGPRLPILRLKTVVGQTDDQGVAHVQLQASANEQIALTLDTSKNLALLPQNPTLDFATREADEFVLVSQKFTVKQAPKPHFAPRSIPRHL